jgi:prepilin-type N-terminal cleavage/methylation domain-containing protein
LNQRSGFTLVELLVSSAILGVVLATAAALLVAGIRVSDPKPREQSHRLQLAMNQVGEDLSHGNWAANCSPSCPTIPPKNCDSWNNDSYVVFWMLQPMIQPGATWSNGAVFLDGVTQLKVRYTISPTFQGSPTSMLIREVFQDEDKVFVREVLASDLVSCDGATPSMGGSFLHYENGTLEVMLRARVDSTGGGGVATGPENVLELHGTWAIR